ncbi:elongation factor P hydroxylase [Parahaliea mediterranea]|uniref:elongation factor P hydroxylase n=1 Tax=Parahaliea mediterranea TaxID=651086 RepID=UPI00187FE635|nr:elongation factor P hydroxylase [Parahaliea mediterranea]
MTAIQQALGAAALGVPRAEPVNTLRDASDATFDSRRLEQLFQRCFGHSENTRLIGGAPEPEYIPATEPGPGGPCDAHRLYFRDDYFASALHETAHWCIAGPARRQQRDFGYWYAPDGRSEQQQAAFQQVEVAPQALEWFFARACGYPFRLSLDNLSGGEAARRQEAAFRQAVTAAANARSQRGLPPRAARWFAALSEDFGTHLQAQALSFSVDDLA